VCFSLFVDTKVNKLLTYATPNPKKI